MGQFSNHCLGSAMDGFERLKLVGEFSNQHCVSARNFKAISRRIVARPNSLCLVC